MQSYPALTCPNAIARFNDIAYSHLNRVRSFLHFTKLFESKASGVLLSMAAAPSDSLNIAVTIRCSLLLLPLQYGIFFFFFFKHTLDFVHIPKTDIRRETQTHISFQGILYLAKKKIYIYRDTEVKYNINHFAVCVFESTDDAHFKTIYMENV